MPEISKMPSAEEIKSMYQKMEQNESENNVYKKQLDKYFGGTMPSHEVINVCSTPNVLKLLGSTAKKVVLNQKDLENAVAESKSGSKSHTEGHDISKEEIYKLSEALRNPIMILKGNKRNQNSVVLITDLTNKDGEKVFVPIALDRQNGRISNISSLYGKKNLSKYISEHLSNILAVNKEKAGMLADTRDQYSQSIYDTVTRYDDSIAYTTANVKFPNQESERDQQQDKPLTGKETAEKLSELSDSITKKHTEYKMSNSVLAAQVEKRQLKIARLEDKNTALSGKIAKNDTKIENQQAKIEDARKTKAYCKTLLETSALPQPLQIFFKSMMDRQENTITRCKDKIGKLKDKNNSMSDKIRDNNKKIAKHTTKIKDIQKVDKFLTNMQSKEGRRENFIQAVSDLRKTSLERNNEKSLKLDVKIAQKEAALTKVTSSVEKVQLRNQIAKLQDKLNSVNEKISKLTAMSDKLEKLSALPDQQADKVIENATNSINKQLAANQGMNEQAVVDTVVNETGKAITNNEIDNRTTPQNEEKSIIEKLNGEINDDLAFFGEVTYETAQHIKEAGYELKDNNLHKMPFEQSVDQETKPQQDKAEKQNENRADKQAEKAFDVAALCAAISHTFAENFNNQTGFVHTPTVFSSLAEKFNFNDVKSAVAVGILDRKNDPAITEQAKKWASAFPLTDILKPYAENKGTLPLEIKSGFLKVFAEKVGTWEQSRQGKDIAVFSRKDIIGSKPKSHDRQQQKPQHDKVQPKKNNPSL